MRISPLRLTLVLLSGLPLLAPGGWQCRSWQPVRPPADERVSTTNHPCHECGATKGRTPLAPCRPTRAECCSAPDRTATLPERSQVPAEASGLHNTPAVFTAAVESPDFLQAGVDLPDPSPPLQLLHCVWLC
jgi:hypothetical protein